VNNPRIMGEHTNPKAYNYITWGTILAVIALAVVAVVSTVAPLG